MNVQGRLMQMHMIQTHGVFATKNKDGYISNRPRILVPSLNYVIIMPKFIDLNVHNSR